jgi:hypothetical protein
MSSPRARSVSLNFVYLVQLDEQLLWPAARHSLFESTVASELVREISVVLPSLRQ